MTFYAKGLMLISCCASLAGCMTAEQREAADDNVCRTARDYRICRENLMAERRDHAIRASGSGVVTVVQQ